MTDEMLQMIRRMVVNRNGMFSEQYVRQAVLDARACKESRRSTESCGCFCCALVQELQSVATEVHKIEAQPRWRGTYGRRR